MNNNIFNYIQNEINEEKISHAFLISTNNSENIKNDIFNLLQKNNIIPEQSIENNISIMTIEPENNLIDKSKILDLQKFIITKSIENKYKVYFIIKSELMNMSSFNKLLKILEEPNENVIGFLITENESTILSTIKSRCHRFNYYYKEEINNINNDLFEKLKTIKNLNYKQIIELKKEILKNEKNEIIQILSEYKEKINQKVDSQSEIEELAKNYKILDNIISLIKSNVNIELCLDKMIIEMRK